MTASADRNKPLHVCLWAPLPPPPGGVSQWALRYRAAAADHGLRPTTINIAPPVSGGFSERSRFDLGRVGVAGRVLSQLVQLLRSNKPAVAHVTTTLFWATPREAIALTFLRAAGVPTVLHLHASNQLITWREQLDPVRRRALDATLRLASVVLVLSRELEDYLHAELPGLQVARIGNMVAIQAQQTIDIDALSWPETSRKRVLFVGALTPLKGVADLCEAVLRIPELELVLVGARGGALDPAEERRMDAALVALRNDGRLMETGQLAHADVLRAYATCDIFCLPSYREGMPNVLLEAMAAGMPCVATPVGAVADVLVDGAGALVPVGDVAALTQTLAALATNPQRRQDLGTAALARVESTYCDAAVMAAYRALYVEIGAS